MGWTPIVIVMGASGAGKSMLGRALSARTGLAFLDGDDFHSERNRTLMTAGVALTDEERWPWLDALGAGLVEAAESSDGAVGSCSALRRAYRERLQLVTQRRILFLYLKADRALLYARMMARSGHFMPVSLLDSQLAVLEPPGADEWSVTLCAKESPKEIASRAEQLIAQVITQGPRN